MSKLFGVNECQSFNYEMRCRLGTDDFLARFAPAIQKQVTNLSRDFRLSTEDSEDLRQDIIADLLSISTLIEKPAYYVLSCIRNAATDSICRITGKRRCDKKSQRQRTVYLEEHLQDDPDASHSELCRLISRATAIGPDDYDQAIMLDRVRKRLTSPALEMVDWVVKEPSHNKRDLAEYCTKILYMSAADISTARLEIVDAMHACGLALNYPPPPVRAKKRMRRTPVERLRWIQELLRYPKVSEAAKAAGVQPFAVNYHCKKLHGCGFNELRRKKAA